MKFKNENPHILIARTDNLGDVVLTLPLAGFIKSQWPKARVSFIGKAYTEPIIQRYVFVDQFLDRDVLLQQPEPIQADVVLFVFPDKNLAKWAQKQKINLRIGTSHRWFHWLFANALVHFSRKKSSLHESQLNFHLLRPLGIKEIPTLETIAGFYQWKNEAVALPSLPLGQKNLILHPKSKGSAREWPLAYFEQLSAELHSKGYTVWVTGTKAEGEKIKTERPQFFENAKAHDVTGLFSLEQLIQFISQADGMVACSTGPLHIAGSMGVHTVGIYPPIVPMHPGRWKPLGPDIHILVRDKKCNDCRKTQECACISSILPEQVAQAFLTSPA